MQVKLKTVMTSRANPVITQASTTGVSRLDDSNKMPAPSQKKKYTKANLPFPHGGNHMYIWAKQFRPSLLSWAGSQEDPFGTNGTMHTEIAQLWSHFYPNIGLTYQNKVIVLSVVRLCPLPLSKVSEKDTNSYHDLVRCRPQ